MFPGYARSTFLCTAEMCRASCSNVSCLLSPPAGGQSIQPLGPNKILSLQQSRPETTGQRKRSLSSPRPKAHAPLPSRGLTCSAPRPRRSCRAHVRKHRPGRCGWGPGARGIPSALLGIGIRQPGRPALGSLFALGCRP